MDLFDCFRYGLGTVVTIYATLVTLQSLAGWYKWLSQPHRQAAMLRRYLLISGLRLRLLRFWADALVCVLLCVAFVLLWHAHGTIRDIGRTLADAHRKHQPLHYRAG